MTRTLNNARTIRRSTGLVALAAGSLVLGAASSAGACDSCNYSMLDEMLKDRSGTAISRDILRAAENQRGMPFGNMSNVQAASERMLDMHAHMNKSASLAMADGATGPEAVATPSNGSNGSNGSPEDARQAVLDRDAGLSIPLTSYVDQDVEADHSFTIRLSEGKTYIGNGVMYDGFLMNDKIPGPTIVVTEGDVVEMTIKNEGMIPHGASIHAAYTQTSAYLGSISPNSSKTMKFRATYPGVFLYHCAPGGHAIPMHVLGGQYGMMVVQPKEKKYKLEEELGHGPDIEIFLNQHEIYASGYGAIKGDADYAMFNGRLFRYVEEPIRARPGDYVRINFLNVGPNLLSTFHIVGIVWDYVYWQGHPDAVLPGGQTVTAGPSDSFVIEFRIPPDEGAYTMLSHAVGSTSRGAIGLIVAEFDGERDAVVTGEGPLFTEQELAQLTSEASRIVSPFGIGTSLADKPVRFTDPDEDVHVQIIGNSYYPKVVEVPVGTTVTWSNEDVFTYLAGEFSGVHNVAVTSGPEPFASTLLAHAETFSHTFTKEGQYDYICTPHPYMKGRVIVTAAPEGPQAAAVGEGGRGGMVVLGVLIALAVGVGAIVLVARRGGGATKVGSPATAA